MTNKYFLNYNSKRLNASYPTLEELEWIIDKLMAKCPTLNRDLFSFDFYN